MRIAVSRAPDAERGVSPLELFFDLVYVFAIGQLSHHLVEHVDLRKGAETAILIAATPQTRCPRRWACTDCTTIAPSPTAAAHRFAEPARTSPAA